MKTLAFFFFAATASAIEPIHIPLPTSHINLDPTAIQDVSSLLVARQLHCQLIRMRGRDTVPEAAESMRFITPTLLRMRLGTAVRFNDGRPVTAKDVVATFDLLRSSRLVLRNIFSWIESVKAVDSTTVEIVLKKPYPSFLKFLGAPNYAILPADFIQKARTNPEMWRAPVGCGKYRVAHWSKSNGTIELAPVSVGRPLIFHQIGSRALSSKEMQTFDVIDATFADAIDDAPGYREEGVFDPRQFYLGLNVALTPWSDRRQRCAFLSRINRKPIIASYNGRAQMPRSFFPRGVLGYSPDWETLGKPGAPFKLGRPLKLAILEVSVPPERRQSFVESIQEAAGESDTKLIVLRNTKRFGEEFRSSGADAIVLGLKSNYLDGYEYLLMITEPVADITGIKNAPLRSSITESQQINDQVQRGQAYREIAAKIKEECIILPLATIQMRRVLVRTALPLPGFGEVPINEYDFSQSD